MDNETLVAHLSESGVLHSPAYIEALKHIDRKNFVPYEFQRLAYRDRALPIGYGATISQPYTVAFLLELLAPRVGEKILDVGSGSGWTTALLSSIVGSTGYVIGIEIVPELVAFGKANLNSYGITNAEIRSADTAVGLSSQSPFDRILVSASAKEVPDALIDQLKNDGTLVVPVGNGIVRIQKDSRGEVTCERHEGFAFVPLR